MENPFLGGPIPIINIIPNYWHILLLAVMVTIGYTLIYKITKLFEPGEFKKRLLQFKKA